MKTSIVPEENPNALRIVDKNQKAINHLQEAIAGGKHWYLALLEAIGMWGNAEEDYHKRHYSYLIDGEAFDWLLLAERLCQEVNNLIPEKEKTDLLFFDRPPIELTKDEFKNLIGNAKYRAYLNYLYGVLVEEALVLAVTEEIRKELRATGLPENNSADDTAYQRIYGATRDVLFEQFRKEKGYRQRKSTTLGELKQFSYWLFKHRLKNSEKARVASDTKKALGWLHQHWTKKSTPKP